MALEAGTHLGPYEIVAPIGAGGMGEVYRARDTRLDRTVAIKVLPEHVAADPDLKQRFEREAKTISSLNHPHICTLYDVGEQDGVDFLVMEYLEGDTLAQRLQKGALPLDQALKIAIEIADALDKAHRQGIVHRDLKPGNIMLTKAGAKLLDFGLAKLRPSGPVGVSAPTMSAGLTGEGAILGTLQYMAPEQLEGKEADHRTDIFAFGAVVYEMATGQRAFSGESQASLIHAIMGVDPPVMSSLQPVSPPALDYIVTTCLAKAPEERWQAVGDVGRQVARMVPGSKPVGADRATGTGTRPGAFPLRTFVAGGVAIAVVTAFVVWALVRPDALPSRVVRSSLTPTVPLAPRRGHPSVAITPDGSRAIFRASFDGAAHLYSRPLDELLPAPLDGTREALTPFVSQDGQWLGFVAEGAIRKVSLDGGPPTIIAEIGTTFGFRGASWLLDDTIVFGVNGVEEGLWMVPARGGDAKQLTTPDLDVGELDHVFPDGLPGGQSLLFTITRSGSIANAQIAILSLETGDYEVLVNGGSYGRYLASGHIVYAAADGGLWAVRFDVERSTIDGRPVRVANDVYVSETGAASFAAANGTLVYMNTSAGLSAEGLIPVWVDRNGREEALGAEPDAYWSPRLSPDGSQLAISVDNFLNNTDIHIYDWARDNMTQLTFTPNADDGNPFWTADGQEIVFRSLRDGTPALYRMDADGSREAIRITDDSVRRDPWDWTPDGRSLLVVEDGDLHLLSWDGDYQVTPLLETPFRENRPAISPDGRWIAYESDESGEFEIYVRRFPEMDRRGKLSNAGGFHPKWSPDGDELFYLSRGRLLAVSLAEDGLLLEASPPRQLSEGPYGSGLSTSQQEFDVSPDGSRFLMMKPAFPASADSTPAQIILVQNWFDELQRLLPVP